MAKSKIKKPIGTLSRKDLIGIAKLAKLSISTLVKWSDESLNVKPATELRIFDAADRFFDQEELRLKAMLQKLTEIEERIAARKEKINGWIEGRIKKGVHKN